LGVVLNGRLNKIMLSIRKLSLNFALVIISIILISYSFSADSDENSIRSEPKSTSKEIPMEMDRLQRRIADELQRKSMESPRRRSSSAKANYSQVALYVEKWREKVEALGNASYPIAARTQHLHGNVMVTVSIMADGTVEAAKIVISSGNNLLDIHVLDSIRKAAPFEQFSDDLNNYADVLIIEKTWVHLRGLSLHEKQNGFLEEVKK
jgi:TonB family protein